MKWLPISELSDKQKDGRWWVFSTLEETANCPYIWRLKYCMFLGKMRWIEEDDVDLDQDDQWIYKKYKVFLSEPLPDLPKKENSKKIEWASIKDKNPPPQEIILTKWDSGVIRLAHFSYDGAWVLHSRPFNKEFIFDEHVKMESVEYWMPIIPPGEN